MALKKVGRTVSVSPFDGSSNAIVTRALSQRRRNHEAYSESSDIP